MAEKTLKTRIVLRNATEAEWSASSVILKKGEVAIATDTGKFKIGDGTHTWANIEKYYLNYADVMSAVNSAIKNATSSLHQTAVYEADVALGGDKLAALAAVAQSPLQGDIGIVREAIAGDKKQYTAYVYNGTAWTAMDGNYNAENVYFDKDLVTTSAVGNIKLTNGQATISTAGKNLKQVFDTIFVKEENPATTQPSVSLTFGEAKAYEVGTVVQPTYSAKLNAGSYTYGPATGITATSWEISDNAGHTASTASGRFADVTVADNTNYKITAKASHGDGAIPVTNTGNAYAAGQIKAGSKTATSGAITGYRNTFYGSVTSKEGDITSDVVRGLSGKKDGAIAASNTFKAAEDVGAMRVIIALPSPRTCTSIKDENGLNAEALSAFTKITVQVEGANSYTAAAYNVYYKDNASANDKANNWVVTVG